MNIKPYIFKEPNLPVQVHSPHELLEQSHTYSSSFLSINKNTSGSFFCFLKNFLEKINNFIAKSFFPIPPTLYQLVSKKLAPEWIENCAAMSINHGSCTTSLLQRKIKTTSIKACTPLIHNFKSDTNLLVHVTTAT